MENTKKRFPDKAYDRLDMGRALKTWWRDLSQFNKFRIHGFIHHIIQLHYITWKIRDKIIARGSIPSWEWLESTLSDIAKTYIVPKSVVVAHIGQLEFYLYHATNGIYSKFAYKGKSE